MASRLWEDDDQLIAALAEAVHQGRVVPRGFLEAAEAAYILRNTGAETATPVYD